MGKKEFKDLLYHERFNLLTEGGLKVSTSGGDGTQVVEVTNPATGKTWMDRNLGASRAATSRTDAEAYGDLYQWGRAADVHQKRNSGTTSTLSASDMPGHGSFILAPNNPWDWRSPQNDHLGDTYPDKPMDKGFQKCLWTKALSVATQDTICVKKNNIPRKATESLPGKGKVCPDGKKMTKNPTFLKKTANKPVQVNNKHIPPCN